MKLAILVVFMVPEGAQKLLEIHLERVRRHTTVPYTIYGVALRLDRGHELLRGDDIRLVDIPVTDQRGIPEHSYYLERLLAEALAGDATHFVTLHVDSFPVRDGWVETLIGTLSEETAFATIELLNTACLLFPRTFYERVHPPFLVPKALEETRKFQAFIRATGIRIHSGTGFALAAHQAGLRWHTMAQRSSASGPAIFDDLVFHLEGALRLSAEAVVGNQAIARGRRFSSVVASIRRFVPGPLRRGLRSHLPFLYELWIDRPRLRVIAKDMRTSQEQLLSDPDGYIARLRAGADRSVDGDS